MSTTTHQPVTIGEPVVVLVDPVLNGRPFKDACAELGYPVVGVYTIAPASLNRMSADHADGDAATLYGSEPIALAGRLDSLAPKVHAIIPATEPAVHSAAVLADTRAVPGNPLGTARARRDKRAMRGLAAARGVPVPRYEVVRDLSRLPEAAARIGLPLIVKPATGAGSHNVFLVTDTGRLSAVAGADPCDLFGNPIDEWLVEEYVRGTEYAINTFSHDGRHTILDVWEYRLPGTGDYDNPYWDFVQAEPDPAIEKFALSVLDAFEIRLGPCHIEVKTGERGPALIEIGARLPGAGIPRLWERHSTFRPYHDTLAVYLGREPAIATAPPRFAARLGMSFIRNDGPPGILCRLAGLDEARRLPGVDTVFQQAQVGDLVPTTRDLGTELVKVHLTAPDGPALTRLIARVRELITVDIEHE
ncbi:ATP-grasp domain-containing protein [Nonomuraea cavernae]|uniref:ATP-grasp domain-containing protein n=1 Tax=Nonomuraea cavernae TaxID=2045107 RepID=UPI0033C75E1E